MQTFTFQKQMEVWFKRYIKNRDPKKVSVCKAKPYGDRYIKFMRHSVFQQPINAQTGDATIKSMLSAAIQELIRKNSNKDWVKLPSQNAN